ncbi:MAG TPA: ketol-acid reductoisomerase [Phycisphaerae bacterium]|nr:ketol-acid reductoisomerase [Phycisphaerae bacterium]HNU46362.1 ketol-acid reductoisomerase [Phycisphaerae bacterium]
MTMKMYRQDDADVTWLHAAPVAIVGYGNQGRAHALNLRDAGVQVLIGQRPGRSFDRAVADGFAPWPVREAVSAAGLTMLTLPDESAADVYAADVGSALHPGTTLGFVHGFNIRFGFIQPPADVNVVMIAPKGPGTLLRQLFVEGKGLPALLAVHHDATGTARQIALAWAAGIGATRAAVVETTFAEETETDLFGEQVVLCGGVSALTKAAFETLVEAGYTPELAYLECVHELKQIVDLLYSEGLSAMRRRVSNTAEYGDLTRGPRLVSEQTRREMRRILEEIRSGEFAREWIAEYRSGAKRFQALYEADAHSAYERAATAVRALMPWLRGE